ncbi:MAG: glycerophosphodiester phosphodiesterase family protein [Asticcacaulis sp.]
MRKGLSVGLLALFGFGAGEVSGHALAVEPATASPNAKAPLSDFEAKRSRWLQASDTAVVVVAHRGCWKAAPENSIEALEACIRLGVDMVEVDVRRTRDGVLVVMHDETVDRTTNGSGRVEDLSWAEIQSLQLRAGAGGQQAPLTEARVPSFEQYMTAAKGRMLINLDAKADVYDAAFAVLNALGVTDHILMKRRVQAGEAPLVQASPFNAVLAMPIIDQTKGEAGLLLGTQVAAPSSGVEVIFTDLAYLRQSIPVIRSMKARVWVNTLRPQFSAGLVDAGAMVDPDAVWGALIDLGVDTLQTDEPEALITYLRSRNHRP